MIIGRKNATWTHLCDTVFPGNAQVVYVEEDEVEAEDPFAAGQDDGVGQDTEEDSDVGDEDLQGANHDDALFDESDDE